MGNPRVGYMSGKWICVSINNNALKEDLDIYKYIHQEMQKIFNEDLLDVLIMGDRLSKNTFEINTENYVFLKVRNYNQYIKELKRSKFIFNILDSYEEPAFIPEEEIKVFKKSIKTHFSNKDLEEGDIVCVKKGFLKNLKGIVLKIVSNEKCKVMFKFYTQTRVELMYNNNLTFESNAFELDRINQMYKQSK